MLEICSMQLKGNYRKGYHLHTLSGGEEEYFLFFEISIFLVRTLQILNNGYGVLLVIV